MAVLSAVLSVVGADGEPERPLTEGILLKDPGAAAATAATLTSPGAVNASGAVNAPGAVNAHGAEQSSTVATLCRVSLHMERAVLALRPAASAASRAALARFGQAAESAAAELFAAAASLRALASCLAVAPTLVSLDGSPEPSPADATALLEQLMKLDDARRSALATTLKSAPAAEDAHEDASAAIQLRDALVRCLGALLADRSRQVSPVAMRGHAVWVLPLLEEAMKAAVAASSKAAALDTETALDGLLDRAALACGCVGCLHSLSVVLAPENESARTERLLQLLLAWLLADGVRGVGRYGMQRPLLVVLHAIRALPARLLPTAAVLAPLGALAGAPHPAVRAHVAALIGRLPNSNDSLPTVTISATPARSKGAAPLEHVCTEADDETMSEAELRAVFSAPLLRLMHPSPAPRTAPSESGGAAPAVPTTVPTMAPTTAPTMAPTTAPTLPDGSSLLIAWAIALELRTKYEPAARAKLAAHWKHVWLQGQLDLMLDSLLEALPLSAEQVMASDGL